MRKLWPILLLLAVTATAHAQNQYFVAATGGSDSNTGLSTSTAWATCNHAVATAALNSAGAIINFIASSSNHAGCSTISRNVVAPARLVLKCTAPWTATTHCKMAGAFLVRAANNIDIGALPYFGFEYTNPGDNTAVDGISQCAAGSGACSLGNSIHVLGNFFHDIGQTNGNGCPSSGGIIITNAHGVSVSDIQVIGNVLDHIGIFPNPPANQMHGIYISTQGAIVQNNIVTRSCYAGAQIYDQGFNQRVSNNVFANNTVGLVMYGSNNIAAPGRNTIDNNVIVNNTQQAVNNSFTSDQGCSTGNQTLYSNNIFTGNGGGDFTHAIASCTTIQNQRTEAPTSTFTNYTGTAAGNYHLKPSSIANTGGTTQCAPLGSTPCVPSTDQAGTPQASPPVIGALVTPASGTAKPVATPTSLPFGNVLVNTDSAVQTSTITNSGGADYSITSETISDGNFLFGGSGTCGNGFVVIKNNGNSCTISAKLHPTTTGAKSGNFNIATSAAPLVIAMSGTGTAPIVSLAPTSLGFGSQNLGTTSATQTITLTNTGNGTLTVSAVALGGTNPTQFNQTNNCTTVNAGAFCTFSVTFNPTVAGAQSAVISITDNASGSPQSIPLTGTGTGTPNPSLTPSSLTFSNQPVGTTSASQSALLSNSGTAPLTNSISVSGDYAQTNNCSSPLAINTSCNINVTFTPTAAGNRVGSLVVTSNGPGSPNTTTLSGTGTQAALALSPTSLTFTALNVGQSSAAQTITLSNPGTASVTLSSVTITGVNIADFGLVNHCGGSIVANGSCTVDITFSPSATGTRTASLTVTDSAPGSPHQATLIGTGTAPVLSLTPTSAAFGNQITGLVSSPQNLILSNTGTGLANISSIALTGTNANQFTSTSGCGTTLAANTSCSIAIRFAPSTVGAKSASLTVTDDAPGSPHASTLSGTGIAGTPVASLTPTTLTFPATLLGVPSAAQTATLQNNGTAALNISSIAASGDYSQTNNCGSSLAVSASCSIAVRFTPTAAGTRTGTLSVTDDAAGSPHTVALSGTGLQALASPSPTNVAFGNAVVGFPTTPTTVTLSNGGTATLQSIVVSLVGTDPGDYILNNTSANKCNATLPAGGSCQVTVAFSPTTTGSRPATLRFSDSAANTPQDVPLTGTGIAPTPAVTLAPTSLNLGSQQVGNTSTSQPVTLTNSGTATLNIASIVPSGDYADVTDCGATLAFSAHCTINVTFTPTTTGTRTGAITVTSDAASSPDVVTLTGQGTPVPVPVATLTPSSLTYGSQQTGTTSAGQDATLKNTGSVNLTITSIGFTGANPGDYTSSTTCVSPIVSAAQCTITVHFAPTAAGTRTANLSVADNASGSPHTVSLSGTAFVGTPGISFNPTSVTFPNQAIQAPSSPIPVQINNPGTATLLIPNIATTGDYSQTNNCGGSVAVGNFCTVQVTFTPLATGTRVGTLVTTDNATGSPHSVALSGVGSGASALLTPTSLNFANQIQGTTSPSQPVTLTNTGNITMALNSISFTGNPTDYAQTSNCASSLGAGASCMINVTFTPTIAGSRPATLVVADSAPGSPHTVSLTGSGTPAFPVVNLTPPSLNFGSIQQGSTTAGQVAVVKNVGTAVLNISSITKTGTNAADYGLTNGCGATLAINATCNLTINFTPSGLATRTAAVSIADDASNSPQAIPLTGVGTAAPAPKVSLSASSLTFASQQVGTASAAQSVIVTNTGDATLNISSIALGTPNATDYTLTNPCGATLAAAASCTLGVVFNPVAAGTRISTVTLTDDASDSPQAFNLTGTAFTGTPTADLSVGTLIYLSQIVLTTSASQTIALTNNGTAALTITSIVASSDLSPGSNEFSRTTNCSGTLPAGGSCTVDVTFTPQAIGARTGKVTFINSASSSPQVVTLMGTGANPPPPPGNAATGIGGRAGVGGHLGMGVH